MKKNWNRPNPEIVRKELIRFILKLELILVIVTGNNCLVYRANLLQANRKIPSNLSKR